MLYGIKTVVMTEKQVGRMEGAELKMLKWALGVTRKNKMKNKYVRGTAKIAKLGDKLRGTRLRWYEHVKRREEGYVRKRIMEMAIPGKKKEVGQTKMDRFGERRHGDSRKKEGRRS